MTDAINEAAQSPGRDQAVQAVVRTTRRDTSKELAQAYPRYIYIDRGSFTLRLYRNLKLSRSYTIAVGQAGYDTPTGLYDLQTKEVNPTWHVPDSDWAGPSPARTSAGPATRWSPAGWASTTAPASTAPTRAARWARRPRTAASGWPSRDRALRQGRGRGPVYIG